VSAPVRKSLLRTSTVTDMGSFISFVPTLLEDIDTFFELAPVSSADVVYDLGSGDGRLLFAALEKGAGKAVGVELDPAHAREARETARKRGLEDKVTFLETDVLDVDLANATVVLCYLYPTASAALKPKFESEFKPGTRIVMESFPIHGWKPAGVKEHGNKTFYLYRMLPEIMDQDEEESMCCAYFDCDR
jgi:SAM-dependent methyltransferase